MNLDLDVRYEPAGTATTFCACGAGFALAAGLTAYLRGDVLCPPCATRELAAIDGATDVLLSWYAQSRPAVAPAG